MTNFKVNLISMIAAGVLLLGSTAHAAAKTPGCTQWLSGYSIYEDDIKGRIVTKVSLYPMGDWDPNSAFEGVILYSVPAGKVKTLEVSFYSKTSEKTIRKTEVYKMVRVFEHDPRLHQFDDFKPAEFFKFDTAGVYTIRLKTDGRLVCEESHRYLTVD